MVSNVGAVRSEQLTGVLQFGRKPVEGTRQIRDSATTAEMTADQDAYRAGRRVSYAWEPDATATPVRDGAAYSPSVPEIVIRDGKAISSGAETALKAGRWLGRFWEFAATAAEVASPASKFLGRVVPVLAVPVAAFDIYKATQVWNDPKATAEDKVTKTAAAGLSTIAAGAGIVALAFPPAAPVALIVAGVAGVGSLIADNWGTVKDWTGKAVDGVKAAGSWVADKAGAAVDGVKNMASAAVDGVKNVASAAVNGVKNVASKAWGGVTSIFSGW